jgi:beta-lactamase regulating signal transducer with metallopeptidase domain/protocatechuate 3,4-dioxygenase beta subunit/peroxiredoxin
MASTAAIDAWAAAWAAWMGRSLIEGAALLLVLGAVWLAFRRRMSAQLVGGLFLLVPLKLAVPIPLTIPGERLASWPAAAVVPVVAEPAPPFPSAAPPDVPDLTWTMPPDPTPASPDAAAPVAATLPASAPRERLSVASWLMLGWAVGVVASGAGLVWRHARMARRVRRSCPLDATALPLDYPDLCRRAGLRRPVAMVAAPWAASPAVWGVFRPRILVPPDLAEGLGPDALRWVLLHELAHVRRRDAAVVLFQRLVQIVYWFHPAAWLANRMIDVQREFACDDAALAAAGVPRRACGDGFLTIVERANASPAGRSPALGLLHSPALIRRRLMRILDARRPVHARLTWGAGALLVLAAVLVLPRVQARAPRPVPAEAQAAPAPAIAAGERTIVVRVVDQDTGKPLPGSDVRVQTYRLEQAIERRTADAEGRVAVAVPAATPEWLTVSAHAEGFVPMELSWTASELLAGPPAEATLALPRGEILGGVVRDAESRPIAGAKVVVWVYRRGPREGARLATTRFPVATDAEGRWRADYVPADTPPETEVMLRLEHPDFVSEPGGFRRRFTVAQARAGERVEVMETGVSLAGRVLGPNGAPVPGARVVLGQTPSFAEPGSDVLRATTDAAGGFRIAHIGLEKDRSGPQRDYVTVEAPGFAPAVQDVAIGPGAPAAVEVRLSAPKPLKGRVVDKSGQPVAGAVVSVGSYGQSRTLSWRGETDAEGRFTWPDGPAEGTVTLEAYRFPFSRAIGRTAPAGAAAAEIVLHRPFHARGTVVDAMTGEPIPRFTIVPGQGPIGSNGRYMWRPAVTRQGADGRFDEDDLFGLDSPSGVALKVEAEGYLPEVFDGFTSADESAEHAFRLRRAAPMTGVVRDPEGQPLAGAKVEVSFSESDAVFGDRPDIEPPQGDLVVTTDAQGRYALKPRERPFGVFVRHERGYGRLSPAELSRSGDLTLRPWSRIEGVYKVGDRPGADAWVSVSIDATTPESTAWTNEFYRRTTDAEGRFVVERAVPGFAVAYTPTVGPVSFEVRPGEASRLALGGAGRQVVGRVATPNRTALPFPIGAGSSARLIRDHPPAPSPVGLAMPELVGHMAAWYRTPEGRAWKLGIRGNPIKVERDGSFRATDVPPGRYRLSIYLGDPAAAKRRDVEWTEVRASLDRTIDIPEGPAGEPIDLGTLELTVTTRNYRPVAVGQKAPEVEGTTTLDGKPLRLADYRGKFVLLDFWATWCLPCIEEEPHLKAAYDAFKGDDRVVMIGLSLDESVEAPRKHVQARGLGWVQGFAGGDPWAGVASGFGVTSIPQTFLIGPDGTVLARDLRGPRIRAAIAEALGE